MELHEAIYTLDRTHTRMVTLLTNNGGIRSRSNATCDATAPGSIATPVLRESAAN
jgi:hypothetical protein